MSSHDLSRPRPIRRWSSALIAGAVLAGVSTLAVSTGSVGLTRPAPAAPTDVTFQQQAAPGEPIPLTPLTDLTSLEATVKISADGTVDGEPTQGDLTIQLANNDQNLTQIDVTGSLLGDVVAQIGGKAVSLFRPESVSVYTVPDGTFAVVTGLFDVCARIEDSEATEVLDQLSPQFLLSTLTASDVARGVFAGDETLDGTPVEHYVIDGDAFVDAAQASSDPNVSMLTQSLTSAEDADLYVATDGGYPVAYRGGFGGTFEPLEFDGDLAVEIELTGINSDAPVTLPPACDNPISL